MLVTYYIISPTYNSEEKVSSLTQCKGASYERDAYGNLDCRHKLIRNCHVTSPTPRRDDLTCIAAHAYQSSSSWNSSDLALSHEKSPLESLLCGKQAPRDAPLALLSPSPIIGCHDWGVTA